MPDTDTWNAYCEASLDLSNQDDVGEYQSFDTVEELIEDLHDDQSTPLPGGQPAYTTGCI